MAAETKIDPMHQFQIAPIFGNLDGSAFVFTNSALWMILVLACITGFMLMGMKRELVPGRWQMAAEGMVGFVNNNHVKEVVRELRQPLVDVGGQLVDVSDHQVRLGRDRQVAAV